MKTKKLVTTSMLIALATILSVITLFALPFGGTITSASMMPVVLIAYLYDTKWGLFSAFVYSLIQMITGMGTVSAFFLPGDSQMAFTSAIMICLIDYIGAFTCLGFAGIFKGKFKNDTLSLAVGTVTACMARYIMHIVSGAIFFGSWAEWFFADATGLSQISFFRGLCKSVMDNFSGWALSIIYSVIYNGAYMLPETVVTLLTAPIVYKAIKKL